MATGIFIGIAGVTQSEDAVPPGHPVPASPSLIYRFATVPRIPSLVGAYARRHPSWTGWSSFPSISQKR